MKAFWFWLGVGLVLAAFRVAGEHGDLFKTAAHCVVFGWFGWGYGRRDPKYVRLAWALSAVELACFLAFGKSR